MSKGLMLLILILISGCAGMNPIQQRVSSGAAIGGALACFPGAATGAAIGALVSMGDK